MKSVLWSINSHLLQLLLVCGVTCYGLWRSDDYMLFGCWKLYEAVCSHPWSQVQYRDGITPRHPSPSLLSSLYSWNTSRRCSTMQAHALHPIPYTVQKARDRSLRTSHIFATVIKTPSPPCRCARTCQVCRCDWCNNHCEQHCEQHCDEWWWN